MEKIVRKCQNFAIFQIQPFEPGENNRKQNKTRIYWRFCLSWLCCLCNSRAELVEIGKEIDELKDKLGLGDLY